MKTLLLITMLFAPLSGLAASKAWPLAEKAAAIAGCRSSIAENAERDYLKRHSLKELPVNFRQKTAGVMAPFLASCDCIFDELERQWTFEYFTSNQDKVPDQANELMRGQCSARGAQQGVPADGFRPAYEHRR